MLPYPFSVMFLPQPLFVSAFTADFLMYYSRLYN